MVNQVALGAGLRDLGNIGAGVGTFLQRERMLDQQQESIDLRREAQEFDIRQKKNQAHGRELLAVVNEATQATRADGSTFGSLGEYLDSDTGALARDRLANSLADSNSRYRAQLKGAPVRTVRDTDGRFVVQARQGEEWQPVTGPDGAPMRISADELAQQSRLDAASAGLAEIVYFKRQARRQLQSGQMTQEQYTEVTSQLDSQGQELLSAAEQQGMDPRMIVDSSRRGDPANWDQSTRDATPIVEAGPDGVEQPVDAIGDPATRERLGIPAAGYRPANPPDPDAPPLEAVGAGVRELFDGTVGALARGAGRTVSAVGQGVEDFSRGLSGSPPDQQPGQSAPVAPPAWATPMGRDAERLVTPNPANTRPGAITQRLNRASNVVSNIPTTGVVDADAARNAAIQYANSMVIIGQTPNPNILANLYAGDDMRGTALAATQRELEYAKLVAKTRATNAQQADTSLKIRDQIIQEQDRAAESAAEAAIDPNSLNRSESVKQLKSAIALGMATHNTDLKNLGVDTNQLMSSISTLPMVSDLLAKHYRSDMAAVRHNNNLGIFGMARERKTIMDRVLKEVSVIAGPQAFRRQIYLGLVASNPDKAANDPAIIDAVEQIASHYESLKTPGEVYEPTQ